MRYFGTITDDNDLTTKAYVDAAVAGAGGGSDVTHNIWLMHYKTFGTESYTYQDKNIYDEMMRSHEAVNDLRSRHESLDHVIATNTGVGAWFSEVYGIDSAHVLAELDTIEAVVNNSEAMNAIAASRMAMNAAIASVIVMEAVANSSIAIEAVTNSGVAMAEIVSSKMATGKYAAGAAGLVPTDYADITEIVNNSEAVTAVVNNSKAMTALVGNSEAMNAVAGSALALYNICKNPEAQVAFIGSNYRDDNFSIILETLRGATNYFTMIANQNAMITSPDTYYYNAAYPAGTTSNQSADECFLLLEFYMPYSSAHESYIKDLHLSTIIVSKNAENPTQIREQVNKVVPGGVSAYHICGNNGYTRFYMFKPK